MFTGLIEEIGKIQNITLIAGGKQIAIAAEKILTDLKIDHSVAVSGVCLTAVKILENGFVAEAVGETLEKSTLNNIQVGQNVNLERAMQIGDRLGGHFVQGHVNGVGIVKQLHQRGENWYLVVEIPKELERYVINEGSIAIDGISLTIANLHGIDVGASVIPHTYKNTLISKYKIGQNVNIETDFLAKYIEKFVNSYKQNDSKISIEKMKEMGF